MNLIIDTDPQVSDNSQKQVIPIDNVEWNIQFFCKYCDLELTQAEIDTHNCRDEYNS